MAATPSALGRAYLYSDRRFSWPLLAMSSGGLTPASARCVRAEWRSLCSVQPVLLSFNELLNMDNWRRRVWAPAIEAAGITRPARIYDLRSTFASDALAAGVSVFELARIMGTSVRMIERHYGALLDGAGAGIAGRLDALDAERDQAASDAETV